MKETDIMCPECTRQFLITQDNRHAYCPYCGTVFIIIDEKTVKYAT